MINLISTKHLINMYPVTSPRDGLEFVSASIND